MGQYGHVTPPVGVPCGADKKLGNSCTVHETIRVKSAAWDDAGELCLLVCDPSQQPAVLMLPLLESPMAQYLDGLLH